MVTRCPHCGSITDRPIFPTIKQRLYDYVLKNGVCTAQEIMDNVYWDRTEPDSNVISVHFAQMRHRLAAHGLKVVCRRGPGATYKLVEIKVPACPSLPASKPTPTVSISSKE